MLTLATGWNLSVERGPDWLFLRLENDAPEGDDPMPPLAEAVWDQMQQHFATRVVLEMDAVPLLHSYLVGQLVLLHKRIAVSGGVMRICGLNETNYRVLEIARLADRFPNYDDRAAAVRCHWPRKPR